jgi:LysM repeat protein/FtsZ-binding cell division protein ZapB
MRSFLALLLIGACVGLTSCATTEPIDPSAAYAAQLRSSIRDLEDKVNALSQNIDSMQSQVAAIERDQAALAGTVRQEQDNVRTSLAAMQNNQQAQVESSVRSVMASNARELEQVNRKLSEVVGTVKSDNTALQRRVESDFGTVQRDVKSLQTQGNALVDRVQRLEREINNVNSKLATVAAQAASSASRSSSSSSSPSSATRSTGSSSSGPTYTRTGTPSSPDIDYSQGYEHKVQPGETLWKIARDYEVTVQDLLNTNPDIEANTVLQVGQTLFVPYKKK